MARQPAHNDLLGFVVPEVIDAQTIAVVLGAALSEMPFEETPRTRRQRETYVVFFSLLTRAVLRDRAIDAQAELVQSVFERFFGTRDAEALIAIFVGRSG